MRLRNGRHRLSISEMYTAIRLDVARGRPIKDLGPVDAEAAAKLRELGIRTVLESPRRARRT